MMSLTLKPLPRQIGKTPVTKTPAAAAKPMPMPNKAVVKPHRTQPPQPVQAPAASDVERSLIGGLIPNPFSTPPSAIPKTQPVTDLNPDDLPIAARLFLPPSASSPTGDVYSSKPAAPAPQRSVPLPLQARRLTPLSQQIAAEMALRNQIPAETRTLYNPLLARSLPGQIPVRGVQRTAALPNPANISLARSITGTVGGNIGGIDINLGDDQTTPAAPDSGNTDSGKIILIGVMVIAAIVLIRRRR